MSSPIGARPVAPTNLAAAFARIDEYIHQRMASGEQRGPGLAIAITDRRRLLHLATYGYANLDAQQPVTPDTRFEVGSIGKSFVALALLQQYEVGRLNLHAPITDYLPWFSINSEFAPITVHDILSHSAGLPMGMNFTPSSPAYEVAALREQHTGFAPSTQFWYSNVGYMLLGLLLERVSGLSYAAALQRGILDPLGMKNSEPIITHDTRTRIAVPYLPLYDDRPWHTSQPLLPAHWLEYTAGDGSLACTVADLATYLRMLMNRGKGVVSEESFALMTAPLITTEYEGEFYGYGINTRQDEKLGGHTIIFHGGEMVGYHASCTGDMDDGVGVTMFNNGPSDSGPVARFALQVIYSAMQSEPLPELPNVTEPTRIDNAAEYFGTYHTSDGTLNIVADGDALYIMRDNVRIQLERRTGDAFYTTHPDFALYNLLFARNEDNVVVEAFHGPDWYAGEHYTGPTDFSYPDKWSAYLGHYRSHNPWMQDFRVFMRKGDLQSISFGTWRRPMSAQPDGSFRLGAEEYSPERVRFDTVIAGKALRVNISGAEYYRVDTP
jgi:D-alanyl-D-alanine carboxypeptidase